MSTVAVIRRSRNALSIWSCSSRPSTTIGSEPMMISQPSRASGSRRQSGLYSEKNQACRIRPIFLPK